jgi:cytochrome c peroxidase
MRNWILTLGAGALLFAACTQGNKPVDDGTLRGPSVRKSEPFDVIPFDHGQDLAKAELGKKLYFDPRLSKSGAISCNSCHNLAAGGSDNLPSSIGHGWQLGPINSPTVLNSRYHFVQFWDGRAKDLEEQAGGPIENPMEMAATHEAAIGVLSEIPGYVEEFQKIYGKKPDMESVTDAIATYERTLITPDARFDRWLRGDDSALSAVELEGLELFKQKGCTTCHLGVNLGGTMFQKMGLVKAYTRDTKTLGRMAVTGKESDKYLFKVPTLRNIELTYPYFHDGSVWDLKEAVKIMASIQLGNEVTDEEADKIVAFLKTLTGRQPEVVLPALPPSVPSTPRPNPKKD